MAKYKKPFMDEDLRESKLLQVLDILTTSEDVPLSIHQIQYRLGASRGITMSKDEIEAHLRWGSNQPNATQSPVKPVLIDVPHPKMFGRPGFTFRGWSYISKRPLTPEEHKATGSPPWRYKV